MKVLIAVLLFTTTILLLGLRWRSRGATTEKDEEDLFPAGLHACGECSYFEHAQRDPQHAQSICPICGLRLLPQQPNSKEVQRGTFHK